MIKKTLLPTWLLLTLLLCSCGPSDPTATPTVPPTPTSVPIRLEADGSGDYPSLEEAVQNAPEGATIALGPGTYRLQGPLSIVRPVRLVGVGMAETEIVSDAGGHVVRFEGEGTFAAEGITFRYDGEEAADVVVATGGEVVFVRCRFTGAVGGAAGELRAGLRLQGDAGGLVRECAAVENDNTGILVDDQAWPTLEENVCSDNVGVGVAYVDQAGGVARWNECRGNGLGGILAAGLAQPTLEENVCNDNGNAGIAYFEGASGTARQNECGSNGRYGIYVTWTAAPDLLDNNCYDNLEEDIQDLRQ